MKMEEKDKWLKSLREQMKDYSEPVPDDLWNRIEKDLTPKVIPLWRKWQSIAAFAAVCIASSVTVLLWDSSSADYIKSNREVVSRINENIGNNDVLTKKTTVGVAQQNENTVDNRLAVVAKTEKCIAKSSKREVPDNMWTDKKNETTNSSKDVIEETVVKEPEKRTESNDNVNYRTAKKKFDFKASPKTTERNWRIGVNGGGVTSNYSSSYGGYGRLRSITRSDYAASNDAAVSSSELNSYKDNSPYSQVVLSNLGTNKVNSDIKHKMPVTFGITVDFDIDKNWALESGVNYTYLSSSLKSGGEEAYYKEEQTLNYIGIPVRIKRNIWKNKLVSLYASAGGEVEKCISGKLETLYYGAEDITSSEKEDLKIKKLQWSVGATVGAQLNVTDRFGIYAEPGVVYYFDDGSKVQTIRKEKPFNFNLQLGVRFSLSK